MNIATIKTDFENCKLMKVFEVEVIDKRTNETDYITFDIDIVKNSLIAQHIGLTDKQERSKKIAFQKMAIDPDFSLDENLQELYSICIDAITNSDFFELRDY